MSASPFIQPLTAPGRGAVAVIRWGSDEVADHSQLDEHFRPISKLRASTAPVGRIMYGHWGSEDVVVVRVSPCLWEINCHGGDAAVSRIATDLSGSAPRSADGTHSESFRSRLEEGLMRQLLKCRTRQTAAYLLSQLQEGVLATFLEGLAEFDTIASARRTIDSFLQWEEFASHLVTPWKVAVVGLPNAGKSSLLNAVLGYQRSIVFEQPGTTRDRIEAEVTIDGWPFVFADTAGVRDDAQDEIEAIGVDAARRSLVDSDFCLLVTDASSPRHPADEALWQQVRVRQRCCIMQNKVDLGKHSSQMANQEAAACFDTSAITGQGLRDVLGWLAESAMPNKPDFTRPLPVLTDLNQELKAALASERIDKLQKVAREWRNGGSHKNRR